MILAKIKFLLRSGLLTASELRILKAAIEELLFDADMAENKYPNKRKEVPHV